MSNTERSGKDFKLEELKAVRARTWTIVNQIAAEMVPGMKESEALEIANQISKEYGVTRFWHKTHIRFGSNTLLMYGEDSTQDIKLLDDDIFFVDYGPIISGYEGDCGDSYVVGHVPQYQKIKHDAKILHAQVGECWRVKKLTGKALYDFAAAKAQELGWTLNLNVNGHRLSDFPHTAYFKGALTDLETTPIPYAWVLEIQIRHPELKFGAFFEDLLF